MNRKTENLETYSGDEREQMFVKRTAPNPYFGPKDNRRWTDSPLWAYCVERHGQRWGGRRAVPRNFSHEGQAGWFFPRVWVDDFALLPTDRMARFDRRLPPAPRIPKHDGAGSFPTVKEFRAWQLPAGTLINAADATVTYSDGSSETWGEIRRRERGAQRAA